VPACAGKIGRVASRWLRWPRISRDVAAPDPALTQLTSIFLDMDRRQGIAEAAVAAVKAVSPQGGLEEEWGPIRDACYSAAAAYLRVTDPTSSWDAIHGLPEDIPRDPVQALHLLETARTRVDEFYARHRSLLESALNRSASIVADADSAIATAEEAQRLIAGLDEQFSRYRSVFEARERLESAVAVLRDARDRNDLAALARAIPPVRDATTAAVQAVQTAPERDGQARRAIASVRTRIEGVLTRASEVPSLISTLLREFAAGCSADLVNNEQICRTHVKRAEELLQAAVLARAEGRAEDALEHVAQARSELAEAEQHVDEVTRRLCLLRTLRADPAKRIHDVRFRLRDAQRLVVDRGEVERWGSVLDAQVTRIDRIAAELDAPHPDYLAYDRAMGEVEGFIANVVNRIRQGGNR